MNTNSVTAVNLAAGLARDLAEINTVDVAVCPRLSICRPSPPR